MIVADEYADLIPETSKRVRTRLAKSELWMMAAMWAAAHAADIGRRPRYPGDHLARPFEEWGDDDPFVELATRYGLSKRDVERLLTNIANECETRATRVGYEEAWR